MSGLNASELVALYTSFKDDARGWLALHRQHFTQFVAIILAVLGASVAAFVQLRSEGMILLILLIGPLLSALLSVLAIFVCDKFYYRYAEHDAISYKLYCLLENRSDLKKDLEAVKQIYAEEKELFPLRWVSRLQNARTIEEYAISRLRAPDASNRFIMLTFAGLVGVSGILTVLIVLVAIL